jgi:hypothetical protein
MINKFRSPIISSNNASQQRSLHSLSHRITELTMTVEAFTLCKCHTYGDVELTIFSNVNHTKDREGEMAKADEHLIKKFEQAQRQWR